VTLDGHPVAPVPAAGATWSFDAAAKVLTVRSGPGRKALAATLEIAR
jgi:hypothetical protein